MWTNKAFRKVQMVHLKADLGKWFLVQGFKSVLKMIYLRFVQSAPKITVYNLTIGAMGIYTLKYLGKKRHISILNTKLWLLNTGVQIKVYYRVDWLIYWIIYQRSCWFWPAFLTLLFLICTCSYSDVIKETSPISFKLSFKRIEYPMFQQK